MTRQAQMTARLLIVLSFLAGGTRAASVDIPISTYLGGQGGDHGGFVAVDASGSIYVAGETSSTNFPVLNGIPALPPAGSGGDGFLTRFAPDGSVVFSTYVGTGALDFISGLVLDSGAAFVAGTSLGSRSTLGFVAKVASSGGPPFMRFLQAEDWSHQTGIVAGPGGLWVCGDWTRFGPSFATGNYLALLSPETLEVLDLVSFDNADAGAYREFGRIAIDSSGYLYVAGSTVSQRPGSGRSDLFVMKLTPDGRETIYTTFLGGTGEDFLSSLVVDDAGRVSLVGRTNSPDLPLVEPVQTAFGGDFDGFVITLGLAGDVVFSSYLGGTGDDGAAGLTLDGDGGLYVTGSTSSADFPATEGSVRTCATGPLCGGNDAFLAHLGPPESSVFSAELFGGRGQEVGADAGLTPWGQLVIVGSTNSPDFPTVNAFQPRWAGARDAFLVKVVNNQPPVCSGASASPSVIWPPNGKMVPISTRGVTDPEGDPITIRITGISQDEPGANFSGIGSSVARVKAERDGKGDGRVYHIQFEATDLSGASCSGEVTVCVPHDRGKGSCVDGRARVPSSR